MDEYVDSRLKEEDNKRKSRRVYSTSVINQLIRDRQQGYDIPYDAFFNRDTDLRAPNITFRMSDEEIEEYQKCYDDAEYFIDKYCKFMTDNGLSTVTLREYQKKIIKIVTDEKYIPENDDYGPANRNVIYMAARQTGKCLTFNTLATFTSSNGISKVPLGVLFNKCGDGKYDMCIDLLYKMYDATTSMRMKCMIGTTIQFIESKLYKNYEFDESDVEKKIIESRPVSDFKVLGDDGYHDVTAVHKTQPYTVYIVKFIDGTVLDGADNHIVYRCKVNENNVGEECFIKDLIPGDLVLSDGHYGNNMVESVTRMPYKLCMYDISIDSDTHRYYANGILSHNTTTISAFLAWMIVFHIDRNILIVANKEKTAIEIVDKIINIFRGLPFFLKPGCDSFGKTGLKLDNGSKIISSATTNTASIGFTIHCVLLDEFAHIPDNIVNNFWRSVYPTLSSSKVSQCIITSTPNGTTNKFYDIWTNPNNSFVKLRTDYWEVPGHDDEWAKQQRADFGEEEFAQEFELQFNINSKMLAKAEDLAYMDKVSVDYVQKQIDSDNRFLQDENLMWHPDFDPNNIGEHDCFIILVDLAEGNGMADQKFKNRKNTPDSNSFTIFKLVANTPANMRKYANLSCNIKDAFRYVQVGRYECSSEDEQYAAKVCSAVCYDVFDADENENVRVMVEMNFNGKSFLEAFQKNPRYADGTIQRTYHTKPVPGEKQRRRLGFKTTANKEYYCLKGQKLISQRRIVVTDRFTMTQIQSFGYVKGKLSGIACHDDLSMPVFNHISRLLDEETYLSWLEEVLYNYSDENRKFTINKMIEEWDLDNPETSDEEFSAMYGNDDRPSLIPPELSGYSGGLSGYGSGGMGMERNPFSENFNQGFGL